jgi:ribosomal protein S18 acetylase RimI-like enzyme
VPSEISLRPATQADLPFLERLYRSVRWDEFAPTGWPEAAKVAFLASQFDYQQRHHAAAFPDADARVVEHQGAPIGQLVVDRTTPRLHLVDISLLPEWRGRGVGGALIGALQDEVRAGRATAVSLNVDRTNPDAHRLYQRLGFVETPPATPYPGLSIEMYWPPEAVS